MPSKRARKEYYEWKYTGTREDLHGMQRAKPGDMFEDDCRIPLPEGGFRKNPFFVFQKLQRSKVHGYFTHNNEMYPHVRTPGHVRKTIPRKRRSNKRQRQNKKRRLSEDPTSSSTDMLASGTSPPNADVVSTSEPAAGPATP